MNRVVHFEIPVADIGATEFYSDVFGWQLQSFPDFNYVFAITTPTGEDQRPTDPGAINGGLMPQTPDAPGPVVMVEVESIDDHVARIEGHGGGVVKAKTEVPGMGHFAYIRDPSGNVLGLWQTA